MSQKEPEEVFAKLDEALVQMEQSFAEISKFNKTIENIKNSQMPMKFKIQFLESAK